MRESEEFVHVVPGEHLGQRVGAGDEEKLVLRPGGGAQIAQRVDCVGGPGPVDVDPADAEPGVRRGRDHRHQVAVLGGRDGTEILLVRLAGRHEDDLVQREVVRDLAGGDQVTMMYGIEGSAHHADASHFFMPPFVPRIVPAQLARTRVMIRDMTSVPDRARVRLTGISSRAYEHPADRSALVALRKLTGFDTLLKLLNGLFNERAMRLNFLASGVKVSERQFPHIHEMLRDGAYVLDMEKVPELFISQDPIVNAMALGTNTPFIVLNSGLVDLLDAEELRAVIGHELGHILSGHSVYRTMLYNLIMLAQRIAWMPIGYPRLRGFIWGLEERCPHPVGRGGSGEYRQGLPGALDPLGGPADRHGPRRGREHGQRGRRAVWPVLQPRRWRQQQQQRRQLAGVSDDLDAG